MKNLKLRVTSSRKEGFTLIELLLVIGIIGVIMGIVVVSVAPRRHFISARDSERLHASKQLQKAIYDHLIYTWEMSSAIQKGEENAKPICKESVSDAECAANGGVPLSSLPPTYITRIPVDVVMPADDGGTGYMVYQESGRPRVYSANMGKLEGDAPGGTITIAAEENCIAEAAYPIAVGVMPYSSPILVGTKLYVTNGLTSNVSAIDTSTDTKLIDIGVGSGPYSSPTLVGTKLYVANRFSNNVSVIDTLTDTEITKIDVGRDPDSTPTRVGTKL